MCTRSTAESSDAIIVAALNWGSNVHRVQLVRHMEPLFALALLRMLHCVHALSKRTTAFVDHFVQRFANLKATHPRLCAPTSAFFSFWTFIAIVLAFNRLLSRFALGPVHLSLSIALYVDGGTGSAANPLQREPQPIAIFLRWST